MKFNYGVIFAYAFIVSFPIIAVLIVQAKPDIVGVLLALLCIALSFFWFWSFVKNLKEEIEPL